MRNLRLGVPGRVLLEKWDENPNNPGNTKDRFLHFMKWDKKWQLVVEFTDEFTDEPGDFEPLRNTNRDLRLRAVEVLPELLQDMLKTAGEETTEATAAAQKARAFVSSIMPTERKGA